MSGSGSVMPDLGSRRTVEETRSLNINQLNHEGYLRPGWAGAWQWTLDGERVSRISVRAGENHLHLSYRYHCEGAPWEDVEQTEPISWSPCRFGGRRPYFLCSGVVNGDSCGRRVVKLYGAGQHFLCRHCHNLSYASQSEAPWDRALRRANKIRIKLGGNKEMINQFPDKPVGMWQRTYERLQEENSEAEHLADTLMMRHLTRGIRQDVFTDKERSFWT